MCCSERLTEEDCEGSELEITSWALKQSIIHGGSEEPQGASMAGARCEGWEARLEWGM